MKRSLIPALLLTAVVLVPAWTAGNLRLGDYAPSVDADAVKGQIPDIGGGDVTIVEFWATWCGPCRKTIPHLSQVQDYYGPRGVQVVGISNEEESVIRPFVDEMGSKMDYAVAVDNNNETSNAYMGGFGVNTIPHAFVVDADGSVAWHGHPGSREMVDVLEELTAE